MTLNPIPTAPKDRPIQVSFPDALHPGRVAEAEMVWSAYYGGFIPTGCIAAILYPENCLGWEEIEQ